MSKRPEPHLLPLFRTRDDSSLPLYRQIYERIRDAILDETLQVGDRLPASRTLAEDLVVSRSTVELAYDHLHTDGFIERRQGSGTYVAPIRSEAARPLQPKEAVADPLRSEACSKEAPPRVSDRGAELATRRGDDPTSTAASVASGFVPCTPSLEIFPTDIWKRLAERHMRRLGADALGAAPAEGHAALCDAIATHLRTTRRMSCTADQVLVTVSTQQALDLTARLLLNPGEAVWMEEPGYLGARQAFRQAGARLVPVSVDEEGIDPAVGRRRAPQARIAYVTPSHQYPTGATLTVARRLEMLEWAKESGAFVVEDDYDSEFRYAGRPRAAMQSVDDRGRLIYIGTFNKVLFPSLRLAYLVVPAALVTPFTRALRNTTGPLPRLPQAILAAFIARGHLARHLRRVRSFYQTRRDALLSAAREVLGARITFGPAETGLHVAAWLPSDADDEAIAARAADAGLRVLPLSRYYLEAPRPGLVLGYGQAPPDDLRDGVRRLAALL